MINIFCFLLLQFANAAEIEFEEVKLKIQDVLIHVKVADTDAKRSHGLMFVTKMKADEGMLFVFEDERPLNFWMKNTQIPLSIGFFNAQGVLVDTQEMVPPESVMVQQPRSYQSTESALYALEMNAKWFPNQFPNRKIKPPHLSLVGKAKSKLLNDKLKQARPLSR